MELDSPDVDNKSSLLDVSITEAPIVEEETEGCDETTTLEEDHEGNQPMPKHTMHILDKAFSIDEDMLDTPLEPIRACYISAEQNRNIISDSGEPGLTSILRRESSSNECDTSIESNSRSTPNRVSFPTDDSLLAIYRDPVQSCSWEIDSDYTTDEILKIYQNSCKRHKTIELDVIKNQIQEVKNNRNHTAIFNLSSVDVTVEVNETLEDVFKVCNFRTLILHDCRFTPNTITEFLNMIEYYESACEIEIDTKINDTETWRAFCCACSNLGVLESISFKSMTINDQHMCMLLNTIKNNPNITILKFDGCTLTTLPSFYLIENLMNNTTLRELYLPSSGLYTKEADSIGRFLQINFHLKVLDISHNLIGDRGLEVLAKGLTKQNRHGYGLSVFVIVNNQITEKSGPTISNIILECKNLHTLNIGYNALTDEVIAEISDSLAATTSLEGLGLQCTLLTCKGISYLGAAIERNTSLQKINLKGNKAIQVTGLETLCNALTNSKISKIEIDESNRSCSDPEAYSQMVKKLNAICTVNKSYIESTSDDEYTNISQLISRKVSLSCEPRYLLPDVSTAYQVTSPMSSTAGSLMSTSTSNSISIKKSRFQITKVQDTKVTSRFKVTAVAPPPVEADEKEEKQKNTSANDKVANVSPSDSVDSLTVHDIVSLDVNVNNE